MPEATLHDTDIYAWSERQAAALRRLAGRTDLPVDLDLLTVAEEIEDLGVSQLNAVESYIRLILSHLVLAFSDSRSDAIRHWAAKAATWHSELEQRLTPAILGKVRLNRVWQSALREADGKLKAYSRTTARERVRRALPQEGCPIPLEDLCSVGFDFEDIVRRLSAFGHDGDQT